MMLKRHVKDIVTNFHKKALSKTHGRYGYVLLLSHMRSYSSLLSHILGSHSEIGGYIEQHLSYPTVKDLDKLHWCSVYKDKRLFRPARLLYDKILHNELEIGEEVLLHSKVKIIFMIREPGNTLISIKKHFSNWDERQASDYYCQRIEKLGKYLSICKNNQISPMVLLSEDLINNTQNTLSSISAYLGLSSQLSEHYKTFANTGKPTFGDTSKYIKYGKIIRNKIVDNSSPMIELKPAHTAYKKFLCQLQ